LRQERHLALHHEAHPEPAGQDRRRRGLLDLDGKKRDLVKLSDAEMRKVRGNDIAMIFQDPDDLAQPGATRSATS
jgi:ABC-type microcin C transport system duplicated ATPase subunit YejF